MVVFELAKIGKVFGCAWSYIGYLYNGKCFYAIYPNPLPCKLTLQPVFTLKNNKTFTKKIKRVQVYIVTLHIISKTATKMTIQELNSKYGIKGILTFVESAGNMAIAMVGNDLSSAQISLYGAHVISFEPAEQDDLLMMSELSSYEKGKPMRGGIPLCFPWFGAHPNNPTKPPHGFARLSDWAVKETAQLADGSTKLVLSLTENEATLAEWPYAFSCELTFVVGEKLALSWTITNTGNDTFEVAPAFHTYFATNDVTKVAIKGLEGVTYLDALQQLAPVQEGSSPIVIDKEVNRCYMDTVSTCVIEDKSMDRTITIDKTGSKSTVVWNPWIETAAKIGDLDDAEYQQFVCVETANVHHNKLQIAAGESHTMTATIAAN
jgi:glucose-6-phosphate 1-epimerase